MVAGREAEGKDTGREIEEGKRGKEAGKDTVRPGLVFESHDKN